MKWTLIYFDDQPQNIQSYEIMLKDRFNVISSTDPSSHHSILKVVRPHAIFSEYPYAHDGRFLAS